MAIWYVAAAGLILISPVAIGFRKACLLLIVSTAVIALLTYAGGGLPGCFVLFECRTGKPYDGLVAIFGAGLVAMIYIGVALAAPIVLFLRFLGFRQR